LIANVIILGGWTIKKWLDHEGATFISWLNIFKGNLGNLVFFLFSEECSIHSEKVEIQFLPDTKSYEECHWNPEDV
jgi:hypothetical protein